MNEFDGFSKYFSFIISDKSQAQLAIDTMIYHGWHIEYVCRYNSQKYQTFIILLIKNFE